MTTESPTHGPDTGDDCFCLTTTLMKELQKDKESGLPQMWRVSQVKSISVGEDTHEHVNAYFRVSAWAPGLSGD